MAGCRWENKAEVSRSKTFTAQDDNKSAFFNKTTGGKRWAVTVSTRFLFAWSVGLECKLGCWYETGVCGAH